MFVIDSTIGQYRQRAAITRLRYGSTGAAKQGGGVGFFESHALILTTLREIVKIG